MSRTAEYVLEESDRGWDVVVTGPWSEGAAQALVAGRADGLVLNYARGFVGHDLDFLAGGLPVRRLEVLHRGITDLSPIERIGSSLEALNVQPADDAELDLSPLERLTSLAAEWWLIAQTVSSVPLRSLITWSYDEPDLHACGHNLDLRWLVVKDAPRLESLSGVDSLSRLEHLGVLLAPNLSDLDALRSLSGSLRDLELEDCVAIDRIDAIAPLHELRFLGVSNCGDIASLSPLRRLEKLEVLHAWGSTRILDGDLSPIAELPSLREVRMRDRARYQPRLGTLAFA